MSPELVVRLLAEPGRLKVFAAVVLGARTPADVVATTGLPARDVGAALRRLADGGLVELTGDAIVARARLFGELARASAASTPPEEHGYADPRIEHLLRAFVRDGKLLGPVLTSSARP